MTQPTSVPIDVQVSGAQDGTAELEALATAMAGVTVGAVAMDRAFSSGSGFARRGGLLGGGFSGEAIAQQKMLSSIAATASVTGQSYRGLRGDVESLTRSLPGGVQQMAATVQATQALGLSQRSQVGQIRAIASETTKLAAATGTYAPAMTQQFGQLNRQLASLDPSRLARFSDVVTTLQAKTGAQATGMLSFAASISPVAQQAGLGESAILGISASFAKLGDDGGAAATAVNRVMTDLNSSVKEGSNTMVAYANATGLTVKQFRALYQANPAQALEQVMKAIGSGSGQSMYLLQSLGLDGARTSRAVAELNQSGGLQQTINTAIGAYGNGSTEKAARAAFNNIDDDLQRLRSTLEQLGTAGVQPLLRPLGGLLGILQHIAAPVAAVANSRAGQAVLTAGAYGLIGTGLVGKGVFGAMAHLNPLAWAAQLATSGPIMAGIAGARAGRYGTGGTAEGLDAAMNATGLFGFFGRRVNSMMGRGVSGGAMGGRTMGPTNRRIYDLFSGYGQARAAGGPEEAEQIAASVAGQTGMGSRSARALTNVYRGASLGWQGYWRLFSQPFRMAMQPAENRDFTLTTAGGPGRKLIDSLKGAWTERDLAASRTALSTFNRDIGGAGAATRRFGSGLREALGAFGSFAGGGLGLAGQGLAGIAKSPLGIATIAAGVGIGGYALYKSSSSSAAHFSDGSDQSKMYSTVNAFRDSLGLASVAAVDLSQQFKDAASNIAGTVTNYARASTVTGADVQAFGIPNASKVVKRYTGSTSEVAAQISADYTGQMTPKDMQAIKQSLYNQGYAPEQIDAILGQVTTGANAGLSGGQIGALLGHAQRFTGNRYQSAWHSLLRGVGGDKSFKSDWEAIGAKGASGPRVGDTGRGILDSLTQSIAQQAASRQAKGGTPYAVGGQLAQMDKAMAEALKSNSADLVVGLEQDLTKSLTGKQVTGATAADIQNAGGFTAWLQSRGIKVYGKTIDQWQNTPGFGQATSTIPTAVTALAGGGNSMFARFFGGGSGPGTQGIVSRALGQPANTGLTDKAATAMVDSLTQAGESLNAIARGAERNMNISGAQGNIMSAAYREAQFQQVTSMNAMTSGQALATSIRGALGVVRNGPGQSQQQQEAFQGAQSTLQSDQQSLRSYYQSRLMTQFNYEIQSGRATQDFYIQQSRAQEDYQIGSARSEEDYLRQRRRSMQDYRIGLRREIQAASAEEFYDPYKRIEAQPVFGAADLEENISQQNQAMVQQVRNLHRVRAEGLSSAAIRTLGLSKTANAQQLSQLVADFENNPALVAQMNREIGQRTKAAGALFKDPGNTTYVQQRQDFVRQMHRSHQDYTIQQNRLLSDFNRQQQRAQDDFHRTMLRMGEDVHNQDLQITGDMKTLQSDMIAILNGQAIDWKGQMVNTVQDTLTALHGLGPKINRALKGTLHQVEKGDGGLLGTLVGIVTGKVSLSDAGNGLLNGLVNIGGGTGHGVSHGRYWMKTSATNRAFIWSELGQESGDYGAKGAWVNGDRAYGAYQIMGANIPSWSKQILGRSLTVSQFLKHPHLQDRIAQGMLLRDVAKYGLAGAAAVWASGSPNIHSQVEVAPGVTVEEYVKSVMARMGNAPHWLLTLGQHPAHHHAAHHAAHHRHRHHHHHQQSGGGTTASASAMTGTGDTRISSDGVITSGDAGMITSGGRGMTVTYNQQHYEEHSGHRIDKVELVSNDPTDMWNKLSAVHRRKNLTGVKGGPKRGS